MPTGPASALLYAAHEVAQRELEWDPTDPHKLDADDDGVACEEVADDGGAPLGDADDAQYRTEDKEVTVIVETIPDKNRTYAERKSATLEI